MVKNSFWTIERSRRTKIFFVPVQPQVATFFINGGNKKFEFSSQFRKRFSGQLIFVKSMGITNVILNNIIRRFIMIYLLIYYCKEIWFLFLKSLPIRFGEILVQSKLIFFIHSAINPLW